MIRLKLSLWPVLFAALWLASAASSQAGGYTYITTQRTVNAGIISTSSAHAPYVFYGFNNRTDIKPFGWNVVNPISNGATSNQSAYWNVDLTTFTVSQLLQYNVLYLPYAASTTIAPYESEKLHRFVDAGGVLWIDGAGSTASTFNPPLSNLFVPVTFGTGGGSLAFPTPGTFARHPLLSTPYLLSAAEIESLETTTTGNTVAATTNDLLVNVLNYSSGAAVMAGQLGAGYVVVTGMDIANAVNLPAGNSSPAATADFSTVPVGDLKFIANLIALAGTHPAAQKNSHGNAASDDALSSSIAPAWNWANSGSASSAAIYGNFVYVTTSDGKLHTFDAYPAEALLGGAPDDGTIIDYSAATPTSYDEIWNVSIATGASAPTVGSYNKASIVFVEKKDGSVVGYDATSGTLKYTLTPTTPSSFTPIAPAPTYYGGRIYAGQSDGTLFVYDLAAEASASSGVKLPVTTVAGGAAAVLGTPAIGIVPDTNSGTTPTNDIVAFTPAATGMYSLFLGSRDETLTSNGLGYYTKLQSPMNLTGVHIDTASVPAPRIYDGNGTTAGAATSTGVPADYTVSGTPPAPPYYGDYDVTFGTVPPLTRSTIAINLAAASATGTLSTPAIDKNGYAYYTVLMGSNSSLYCVQDAPQFNNVKIRWRFRLPFANEEVVDADGVSYSALKGFQFIGSPIADNNGLVYAIAQNGASATVLCFNTNQAVYADTTDASTGTSNGNSTISQPISPSGTDEFGDPDPAPLFGSQFYHGGSTVTFTNFGYSQGSTLYPNFSEPEPISVLPPPVVNGQTATQPPAYSALLHTNLAWQATITLPAASVSGLSKDGDTLFLTATNASGANPSVLYKIDVNTHALSSIPIGGASGIGTVTATPSAANGIVIATGASGVAALTRQTALIADNNRILETDLSGNMLWAVDSTVSTSSQGATTQIDFKHPTYLSQFATDDYLVADTGNNRCVRFNRSGHVLWELTRFTDPNNLLTAGETMTLNQPTSVVVQRKSGTIIIKTSSGNVSSAGTQISYLVADSGNSRIIEVTDAYDANGFLAKDVSGNIIGSHILTWVSHTFDKQNRLYHYSSADYYTDTASTYIFAVVSNTRIAQLPGTTTPGAASGDTPGGSIALLNYGGASDGLLYAVVNSFVVGPKTYQITNPRFLQVYTPPNTLGATALKSLLFADDNGAFDFSFSGSTLNAGTLHFTKNDYDGVTLPINNGTTPNRAGLPFQPTCIQRLGNNASGMPTYLITQTYSQGELGNANNKIGGEIFEVDGLTAVGGFGTNNAETLSRPVTTGPLTQPTFAIRP